MPNYGYEVMGKQSARRKLGEKRDPGLIIYLHNRTRRSLDGAEKVLQKQLEKVARLTRRSNRTKNQADMDDLQREEQQLKGIQEEIDHFTGDMQSINEERAELERDTRRVSERKAKEKAKAEAKANVADDGNKSNTGPPTVHSTQAATLDAKIIAKPKGIMPVSAAEIRRKQQMKKEMAAAGGVNTSGANVTNHHAAQAHSGPTNLISTNNPKQSKPPTTGVPSTAGVKRKAESEQDLQAPPFRKQKLANDVSTEESTTVTATPPSSRATKSDKAGRGVISNPRKDAQTDRDRLRQTHAKVTKHTRSPEASRRSSSNKIITSRLKNALDIETKDSNMQSRSSEITSSDRNTAAHTTSSSEASVGIRSPKHRLAKVKGVKRRATEDEDNERDVKKAKVEEPSRPRGLLRNRSNIFSCFSNVVIRLLATALEGQSLDALLGKLSRVDAFDSVRSRELANAIKRAAAVGEEKKVSAVLHHRQLLETLRVPQTSRESDLSAQIFQNIVTYGSLEGVDRKDMDGDKAQQDCFLYYQTLLNILLEDKFASDPAALNARFEVETAIFDTCKSCGHQTTPHAAVNNYYNMNVPDLSEKDVGMTSLNELLEQSVFSDKDKNAKCSNCGDGRLFSTTDFMKLPECLVIQVNRIFYKGQQSKLLTNVSIDRSVYIGQQGRQRALFFGVSHRAQRPHARIWPL